MGEQILVFDLARNLIRLSGFLPGREIAITFTGLRPGEKLVEDLVGPDEVASASPVEKVLAVRTDRMPDSGEFAERLATLEWLAASGDTQGTVRQLQVLEPHFAPGRNWTAEARGPPARRSSHRAAPPLVSCIELLLRRTG